MAPPDPEMRSPVTGQGDRAKVANLERQKQRYLIEPDFQAALFVLAPKICLVALLAFVGGAHE
jgi:hypothetical protein